MEDVNTSSISKGCFAVLGNDNLKSKSKDSLNNHVALHYNCIQMGKKVWQSITNSFENLQKSLQENIFSDLLLFVRKKCIEGTYEKCEIPTAIVNAGVNMPDHAAMYGALSIKLKKFVTPFVIILQANKCSSLKSLMRTLGDQLLEWSGDSAGTFESNCSEDDWNFMKKKSLPLTMTHISKWHQYITSQEKRLQSTSKKTKLMNDDKKKSPIVIIFEDLEAFSPKILQDFILISSFHVSSLPLCFIFGVATTWSGVSERMFPHSVIVHLSVKIFSAPSASSHLALLLDQVLLSWNYPFKLSGRCLQLLLDVFLCHDFSITNFMRILKFCILEHFYEKPSSYLCTCDQKEAFDYFSRLNKHELAELRKLPSVHKYLSTFCENRLKLLKNESNLRAFLLEHLKNLHTHQQIYFIVLRILHALTISLPNNPMGRQLREVFIACSKDDISSYPGFTEAFMFLKVSSRDQLLNRLRECLKHVINTNQPETDDEFSLYAARNKFSETIKQYEQMEDDATPCDDSASDNSDEDETLKTVKYAYQLQERLRNRCKMKKRKKLSKFEKIREEILNYLTSFFNRHLRRVQNLPLYEIFYFDSASSIKQRFIAAPRLSIHTGLSDPYQYLKIAALETVVNGVIPTNAPDICVAYKLHNECGNYINLFDWMQAFHTIVTSTVEEDLEIDEITQARFVRAVSELQFLGFIRPTKKKTDHVQRLTWSQV